MAEDPGEGGARPSILVISGGQTGVDRAALDAAIEAGLPCGGWCPAGRLAEDGTIPLGYPLMETKSRDPGVRTRENVEDSDGTLIVVAGRWDGGSRLAEAHAQALGRPLLTVDLRQGRPAALQAIRDWLAAEGIVKLNVAGPRESSSPGIQEEARALFSALFQGRRS